MCFLFFIKLPYAVPIRHRFSELNDSEKLLSSTVKLVIGFEVDPDCRMKRLARMEQLSGVTPGFVKNGYIGLSPMYSILENKTYTSHLPPTVISNPIPF